MYVFLPKVHVRITTPTHLTLVYFYRKAEKAPFRLGVQDTVLLA